MSGRGFSGRTFAGLQHALPQHALSRVLGVFAASRFPPLKWLLIEVFKAAYRVDMTDYVGDGAADYDSFNGFFTRPLRDGARPLPTDPAAVACPADGTISQVGSIDAGELVQAKGQRYQAAELVGDDDFAATLEGGSFATIYLAPRNYHRVHAPLASELKSTLAMPGKLFSVNAATEAHVPGLFARNERLILRLATEFGDYALVLVGAMIVASIDASFANAPASPYRTRQADSYHGVRFERGDQVAAFLLGSTVIALFPPGAVSFAGDASPGVDVRMGMPLGRVRSSRRDGI